LFVYFLLSVVLSRCQVTRLVWSYVLVCSNVSTVARWIRRGPA